MKNSNQIESDLLGICIPTYNRAIYLDKCLSSITENCKKYGFPIYISDNCSVDETESVVDIYEQSYGNVIYTKNQSNIGPYLNILNVMEMARTRYIWLMGDDDAILPNKIEKILKNIIDGNDYIVVNSIAYDINLRHIKEERIINCDNVKKYWTGDNTKLLLDLKKWAYHGFISSMIIRRELILPLIEKYRQLSFPLYNNSWLPLAIFYEAISHQHGIFVCDPIVMNRDNPRSGERNFWSYAFLDHLKVLEYLDSNGFALVNIRNFLNITSAIYIAMISRHKDPHTTLFNEYVKKKKFFPYCLKLLLLLIDNTPKLLIDLSINLINKLKYNI
jgi:glycosyltransferase involved in cell wall biosynthesis